MSPLLWWQRIGVVLAHVGVSVLVVAGCDDDTPSNDAGNDADQATNDADDFEDTGNYPPFDCIDEDDPLNMTTCMLPGAPDGTWCDGDCRPACFPPTECPEQLVCKRHGVNYLCFPE